MPASDLDTEADDTGADAEAGSDSPLTPDTDTTPDQT